MNKNKGILMSKPIRLGIFLFALVALTAISYLGLEHYTTPKDEWYTCKQDNDCSRDLVCDARPLNKNFILNANLNASLGPVFGAQCSNREKFENNQVFCVKSICTNFSDIDPEDWGYCEKSEECTIVKDVCGLEHSFNVRFAKASYASFQSSEKMKVTDRCEVPISKFNKVAPYCENKICKGGHMPSWLKH